MASCTSDVSAAPLSLVASVSLLRVWSILVFGTMTSTLLRNTASPSSPTARLPAQGSIIHKTSVFSLSSSCPYLKTYKPYAEECYESKYIYTGCRIPQIYVWQLALFAWISWKLLRTSKVSKPLITRNKATFWCNLVGGYILQRQWEILLNPSPVVLATSSIFMFFTAPFWDSGIFLRFIL